jgi:periplasmic protein CpxP/Spy
MMKKILVFALMVMLGLGSAFAQRGGTPEERLQRSVDQMKEALALTPEQVTKITPILKEGQEKASAARAKARESGATPDREKMMAELKKSTEEMDVKIRPILKPDQVTKLADYRKQQEQRMKERMNQ